MAPDRPERGSQAAGVLKWLAREGAPGPGHQALDLLIGEWRSTLEWRLIPGEPPLWRRGHMSNRWILGRRFVESVSTEDGDERARVYYGHDKATESYQAVASSVYRTTFDMEDGVFDKGLRRFDFMLLERFPNGVEIRAQRTIVAVSPDRLELELTYPDHPPGTYAEMSAVYEREH